MVEKLCRLCFKLEKQTLDIFSVDGINLKIACVIRAHFESDEVRADDIFPNFICTKCWLKLADFHDFYNAVDEAKSVFLRTVQKEEIPDDADIDVNTDSLESENSSSLLRDENTLLPTPDDLMDFDYVDVKPEPPRKPNETPYVSAASRVVVSHRYTVDESTSSKMDKAQLISDSLNMTCFCCGRQIRTLLDLTDHYQVEHSEERCLRVKCCDTILRLTDLLDHMEYHLHPDKFKCEHCNQGFPLTRLLKRHRCIVMPQKRKVHTPPNTNLTLPEGEIRPTCTICNKSLSTKARLAEHMKNIHRRECHVCGEQFDSTDALSEHMQTHNGVVAPKVYCDAPSCHICGMEFTVNTNVARHLKLHEKGTTQHTCKLCGRSFKSSANLRRHSTNHEDEGKTFKCTHCETFCSSRRTLIDHYRKKHHLPLPFHTIHAAEMKND